jgi:hypothetical protein
MKWFSISLRYESCSSIFMVQLHQYMHPVFLYFPAFSSKPIIYALQKKCLILAIYTFHVHIFQLNSCTASGIGPTANIYLAPLNTEFEILSRFSRNSMNDITLRALRAVPKRHIFNLLQSAVKYNWHANLLCGRQF